MGNICALDNSAEAKENARIEAILKASRKEMEDEVKILLLGAGESGKSTIAKQMKIIHLCGFTEEEQLWYKRIVHLNVMISIKTLLVEARARNIDIQNVRAENMLMEMPISAERVDYTKEVADAVTALWQEPGIKEVYALRNQYQLSDSASYFLDECQRFHVPHYSPSDQDILKVRSKTTGIVETEFFIQKKKFKLVDVGGQRNERKKWIHCFQGVTCVLFCAALNEYDMRLSEDNKTNRMHESLKLFGDVINNEYFRTTPIILFFNKTDLFAEKVKTVDLSCCFPNYTDGVGNREKAFQYIRHKYLSKDRSSGRKIYDFETCATDTTNVRKVFHTVEDILFRELLNVLGF